MGRWWRRSCGLVVAGLAWLAAAGETAADGAASREVADRVLACTVGIESRVEGGSFSGSGVVISPDGHVLTATSVVPPDARDVSVLFPGYVRRPATLVAAEPSLGVALVKVEATGAACLSPADALPPLGSVAFTAGDVDGVMLSDGRASFSRGVVSGIYSVEPQGESAYAGTVIETTAAVNPGSDGGPLVDAEGRLGGVISLAVSPLRWQGVAVPAAVLREKFAALATIAPPAGAAVAATEPESLAGLRRAASVVAGQLVGIEVERTWGPERLPVGSWAAYRGTITGWEKLAEAERRRRFAAFADRVRMLEVNQLLRRPPGAVTGLVVSADGFVLTSLFNVADDTAFVAKATGRPPALAADAPADKLLAEPEGGFESKPNSVRGIRVVLPDGSRREARIHARHEPLGIAILKLDAEGLAWCDLPATATSPQLGDHVAVVGHLAGATPAHTLNAGIVSAASRTRGYRFQTDALVNYGNSGGPVIDPAGNLLGVATAPIEPDTILGRIVPPAGLMRWTHAPNSGVGLVARADRIAAVLEELKAGRSFDRPPGPFLGVQADESRALGDDVVIGGVGPGSPAAEAGLAKGDVLVAFDGVELRSWRDLTERIAASKAGDTVELTVRRRAKGPRLVVAGRDVETLDDLKRLKQSLKPGDTFEGTLTTDDTRTVRVVLGENR